jgi:cytochrome c peroxidase
MRRYPSALVLLLFTSPVLAQGAPPPQAPGLPPVPVPAGNSITPAKVRLGQTLFWDEQLSASGTVSCGTCHIPTSGGGDPRTLFDPAGSTNPGFDDTFGTPDDVRGSQGVIHQLENGEYVPIWPFGLDVQVTSRKAPSVINAAFAPRLFWDGRAGGVFEDPLTGAVVLAGGAALESQASEPPLNTVEMAHVGEDWATVAARVEASEPLRLAHDVPQALAGFVAGRSYPDLFALAFGTGDVTPARILMAIATYERTLVSDESPWDAFLGGDTSALTPLQQQGRNVFFGPGRCNLCHGGPLFTDQQFHDIGVRPDFEDRGLGAITGSPIDNGRFKTPSLRNVALRAPYFHNGGKATLAEVVAFYNGGGDFQAEPLIQPLGLTPQQRIALVAFLGALTDPRVAVGAPPFDRPGLYTESTHVPIHYGSGSPGAGGVSPSFVAVEPPTIDSPQLSLGVRDGLGGTLGQLAFDVLPATTPLEILEVDVHLAVSPFLVVVNAGALDGPPLPGAGFETLSFAVNASPALVGTEVFAQWFLVDPLAPEGLAASEGVRLEYF